MPRYRGISGHRNRITAVTRPPALARWRWRRVLGRARTERQTPGRLRAPSGFVNLAGFGPVCQPSHHDDVAQLLSRLPLLGRDHPICGLYTIFRSQDCATLS
jgi:hypothetical protein